MNIFDGPRRWSNLLNLPLVGVSHVKRVSLYSFGDWGHWRLLLFGDLGNKKFSVFVLLIVIVLGGIFLFVLLKVEK